VENARPVFVKIVERVMCVKRKLNLEETEVRTRFVCYDDVNDRLPRQPPRRHPHESLN